MINGWVYDDNPAAVDEWCKRHVGPGHCNYTWTGMSWHVTIVTVNGHETLRYGDSVVQVADNALAIIHKERL